MIPHDTWLGIIDGNKAALDQITQFKGKRGDPDSGTNNSLKPSPIWPFREEREYDKGYRIAYIATMLDIGKGSKMMLSNRAIRETFEDSAIAQRSVILPPMIQAMRMFEAQVESFPDRRDEFLAVLNRTRSAVQSDHQESPGAHG